MIDLILSELKKFESLEIMYQVKSFVIFDLPFSEKGKIFRHIKMNFQKNFENLKIKRSEEIAEMLEEIEPIKTKYDNIYKRYKGRNILGNISEWKDDEYLPKYKAILSRHTELRSIVNSLSFEDIDLVEMKQNELLFDKMNDELNFSNLIRRKRDEDFKKYYKLNRKEKEYVYLKSWIEKKKYAKYIFCHNVNYNPEFKTLFQSTFKWDRLKWSVFSFEISQKDFECQASNFVRQEMYNNRIVLNYKKNVNESK